MLSIATRTIWSLQRGSKLLRARRTAFNSKKFMWRRLSGSDQTALAVESPKCAPQPSFEASVNS